MPGELVSANPFKRGRMGSEISTFLFLLASGERILMWGRWHIKIRIMLGNKEKARHKLALFASSVV